MSKTVLIVEDNDLNRRLFNDVLEAEGYATVVSEGGADIVELAQLTRPDLIVMDICLPDADGLEATRRIKADASTRYIPVIAVTACALEGDEERFRSEGCADYVSKPISVVGFLSSVEKLIN